MEVEDCVRKRRKGGEKLAKAEEGGEGAIRGGRAGKVGENRG